MGDSEKDQVGLPRVNDDGKVQQRNMSSSSGALQLNNGGDLQDFNHQALKIGFYFNNGTSSRLERPSASSPFGKSSKSPKESIAAGDSRSATPEDNGGIRQLNGIEVHAEPRRTKTALEEVAPLENNLFRTLRGGSNREARKTPAEVSNPNGSSSSVASEQFPLREQEQDEGPNQPSIQAEPQNLDETSKSVAFSEDDHLDNQKRTKESKRTCLRRWRYTALAIFSIIIVAAAVGIPLGLFDRHKDPPPLTAYETASVSTTSTTPSQSSKSTSALSQKTNNPAQSSTVNGPSSNITSATSTSSIQTLTISFTPAAADSTNACTSNCIHSTPTSTTSTSSTSTTSTTSTTSITSIQSSTTTHAPAKTTAPTTKTTSTTKRAGLCATDGDCPSTLQCDYTASTCYVCTYATLGMGCSGNLDNCCDPWCCNCGTCGSCS